MRDGSEHEQVCGLITAEARCAGSGDVPAATITTSRSRRLTLSLLRSRKTIHVRITSTFLSLVRVPPHLGQQVSPAPTAWSGLIQVSGSDHVTLMTHQSQLVKDFIIGGKF